MTWGPFEQMSALISSRVNAHLAGDAVIGSGPTVLGIFYTRARLAFYYGFQKRLVAGSLGLIQLQNERHFLLEYTKF